MNEKKGFFRTVFSKLWSIINTFRKIILNLIFFSFFIVVVAAISNSDDNIVVPDSAALVLNLSGEIVEQKKAVDPMSSFMSEAMDKEEDSPEVLLSDIVETINTAKKDNKIKVLVLQLKNMKGASTTKLSEIAIAIDFFKTSGKPVIAIGEQYNQQQYYLASYADEIWLDPKGHFMIDGYGRYSLYFKSAIEKLSISQHVFRVGTYKSAVEPFLRDDMSAAAKKANKLWLNDLWQQYKKDVAAQRGFGVKNFDETTQVLVRKLKAAGGNFANYALENQWVDKLKTHHQIRESLIELVGPNKKETTFNQISFKRYLKATKDVFDIPNPNTDKVAIVVAKGTIYNGTKKAGEIGGDSTAKLLKRARENEKVKAVVLRVDSPGGSAFASEIIRREIDLLKEAGKPVVASMGTYAASGGYWISAPANKIYASPSTITGSIGIFGMFMTFENSLSRLGIYTDGVGTTELAGFSPTRPLSKAMGSLFQLNIERGYEDFINLVAENRSMTFAEVDKIAQGRVWSGTKAKEIGLVDELGTFQDAIYAAAKIAGLGSNFDTLLVEKELSAKEQFLKEMFGHAASLLPELTTVTQSPTDKVIQQLLTEFEEVNTMNDPQGIYSLCLPCQAQ